VQQSKRLRDVANPRETCWVVDGRTGCKTPYKTAKNFNDRIGISGVVLTPHDGDAASCGPVHCAAVTGKTHQVVGNSAKRWMRGNV